MADVSLRRQEKLIKITHDAQRSAATPSPYQVQDEQTDSEAMNVEEKEKGVPP